MTGFLKFLFSGVLLIFLASCGGYDALLKSRDYQGKYDAALAYYEEGRDNRALTLLLQVEAIYEGTEKADTVQFYIADLCYRQGLYDESAKLFDDFRKNYARSPFATEAEYLYAMSYYAVAPSYELDQMPTEYAIIAFAEFTARHRDDERSIEADSIMSELQQRLYDKAFEIGETYYNIGYYNAAITSFRSVLRKYPEIPHREQILYLITRSNYLFARNSITSKQRERYYNTIDAGYNYQAEFPDGKHASEVKRIVNNATKLSAGKQMVDNANSEAELTEKQILRNNKKYEKLQKQVDKGKMTAEEVEEITAEAIEKAKERNQNRSKRFEGEIDNSLAAPTNGEEAKEGNAEGASQK